MKRISKKNKGISLIEMVIAIVVVGLAIPALTRNWFDVTTRSIRSEMLADTATYAQQLMEEIGAKRFDEEINPPWTSIAQFGAERPDENDEPIREKYDDVDDFDGFNDTLAGYSRAVKVEYVNLTQTTWGAVGVVSDFKRVSVSVSRPGTSAGNVTMATIFGRY